MRPAATRILVADDHAIVRHGLRLLLDREPDLTVVAEAADGAQAVDLALAGGVDLVILDIAMPRMTGLQAARELSLRCSQLPMLILSMYDNDQFLLEALKAGAGGYVLKSGADRDIVTACRAVVAGDCFLYPSATTTLVRDYLTRAAKTPGADDVLTPARRRSSNSSPKDTVPGRSPPFSASASRPSTGTAPTSWTSSACTIGSS